MKVKPPSSEDPGRHRIIDALQQTSAAIQTHKAQLLAQQDMLPAHYALLGSVRSNPGVTGAKLAPLLGVTHQNVSGLVARLTGKGWLDRRIREGHPQVLELHLTDDGLATLDLADRLLAAFEARVAAALGRDMAGAFLTGLEQVRKSAKRRR